MSILKSSREYLNGEIKTFNTRQTYYKININLGLVNQHSPVEVTEINTYGGKKPK